MAPGSSVYIHNVMNDREGDGKENISQEATNSSNAGLLTTRDVNRMGNVDLNLQSWPVLSKNILPPPKKRHDLVLCQPAPKVSHTDCKENSSDRGGSLTSRISSLSPGTKRKILGYAADGSIPPLPPRQKRVKMVTNLSNVKGKLCTKFARSSEPSGLLGDLKPGIMRKQTRTRTEVHALLSAVVGDLITRDTLSAAEDFFYEIRASDEFSDQLEEPPIECSGFRNSSEEGVEQPKGPGLQESLDAHIDFSKPACAQNNAEKHNKCAEADDGSFDTGLRTRKGLISTHERTSGFVPFQRNGRHACNRTTPMLPIVSRLQTADLRDLTGHNQQAQLPLNMKQELDITVISSREACAVEASECKQEDLEEDTCKYPLDFSSLSEGVGSVGHEDGTLLQQQDSKLLVSVTAANVATCWLELLSLDVKGRLAALKSSKRRVGRVIVSGELDLDAPLLPGGALPPPTLSPGDGQPLVDNWRKVFESMDRALTMEGQKLESWLQQIHVMQSECQRDMILSSNNKPTSFSEPTPPRTQEFQQVAVPLGASSVMSSRSSAS